MKLKRMLVVWIVLGLCVFSGCSKKNKVEPEVGKWHGEIKLSDFSSESETSTGEGLLSALLTGDDVCDVDVEFFADGTFMYEMNLEKLREGLSEGANGVIGLFADKDWSVFVDRFIQGIMPSPETDYEGTYTKDEDGVITAVDGESKLYFQVNVHSISQIDENGNEIAKLKIE